MTTKTEGMGQAGQAGQGRRGQGVVGWRRREGSGQRTVDGRTPQAQVRGVTLAPGTPPALPPPAPRALGRGAASCKQRRPLPVGALLCQRGGQSRGGCRAARPLQKKPFN